ncbi:ABC-2 family transporter protein [Clostridium sp.]|uniref:ABC transporter permease n=1 Tax=Clostridium sp. TaxID=1506 RepID=UPI002603AE7E|nr:ABC-2 family transporter protein [Clostridium sp.]
MKRYFKIYKMLFLQYLKGLMEYKIDFFVGLFAFLFTQAAGIGFIYLIFLKIPQLNGWTYEQILFIYGFSQIPRAIDHFFTDNLWLLSGRIISRGEFDKYLIRPINPLFHIIAEVVQPDAIGEMIVGVFLVTASIIRMHITISLGRFLIGIFLIICGTLIYFSIKLVFASVAFWTKYSQQMLFMIYQLSDFAKYPIGIYAKWIRVIITFIIPFAFVAFFPAGYIVGKNNAEWAIFGTLIAAITSIVISGIVWRCGLKAYESAGS